MQIADTFQCRKNSEKPKYVNYAPPIGERIPPTHLWFWSILTIIFSLKFKICYTSTIILKKCPNQTIFQPFVARFNFYGFLVHISNKTRPSITLLMSKLVAVQFGYFFNDCQPLSCRENSDNLKLYLIHFSLKRLRRAWSMITY